MLASLPCVKNCKSETGCTHGRKCFFRHVEADERPIKKSKKGGANAISCIVEGVYTIGLCISRFLSETNPFFVKRENWDQDTPSNSPRAPGTKEKFGKERVHREELSKSVTLMSVVFARPKF